MLKIISLIVFLFASIAPAHANTVRELYEQAVDAFNQNQFDKAVSLYQQINKMAPHFAPAYVGIGLALKSKGADMDEVIYYYKMATDMDPTNAPAFEQLGRLYYSLNKFERAEKSFLKALAIDPNILSAKLSLAWIYLLGKSKPGVAVKYFKSVVNDDPTPNAYFGLGMAYFANNDRVEAIEVITKLRQMGEDDFANRLETMVRENRKVVVHEETPVEPMSDVEEISSKPTAEQQSSDPVPPTGFKVRLNGKLSDID